MSSSVSLGRTVRSSTGSCTSIFLCQVIGTPVIQEWWCQRNIRSTGGQCEEIKIVAHTAWLHPGNIHVIAHTAAEELSANSASLLAPADAVLRRFRFRLRFDLAL